MAIKIRTLDQLHDLVIGVARALLPTRDWSRWKPGWKFMRAVSVAATDLHAHIKAALQDLRPDTAKGTGADAWGNILGVIRQGATPARKSNALQVQGTLGSTVTVGDELVHQPSGLRFQVNENETIPAALFVNVDIVALDKGAQTRLSAGEVLTFVAPPAGIQESAVLVLDIDEDGVDGELDGPYVARYLEEFKSPRMGGAQSDYVAWPKEITGIAAAYAYPNRNGLGSVDVAALHTGRGSARLLTGGEITTVYNYIAERQPAPATLRVLEVDTTDVDVEVTIVPNGEAQYVFDWDDSTPLEVLAWTGASRTLQFTTDRPASMIAGGRLTIKPAAGGGTGEQLKIESLSGTDAVVLEEAPALAPAATDIVYAGGPLVDTVRDAILAHIDSLGTSNPDASTYGTWEANLRPENLSAIAQGTKGVRRSTVVAPGATVEPADNPYPDDETVFILAPRRILVRKGA